MVDGSSRSPRRLHHAHEVVIVFHDGCRKPCRTTRDRKKLYQRARHVADGKANVDREILQEVGRMFLEQVKHAGKLG